MFDKAKRVGEYCGFNQYYKSKSSHDVLNFLSRELKVEGIVYDNIEAFMKYRKDHLKIIEDDYESKFNDYREIDEQEINNHINKKLGDLPIHQCLQHLSLNDFLWDFDAVSLYPSAMGDPKSVNPKIETGYVYTPDMKDEIVKKTR